MPDLDWLTARPIAHRGLHDAARGVIENTASAFRAALGGGYAIETDLQISADDEVMVHHDDALGRLTEGSAPLADLTARQIKAAPFKTTADRIMTLGDLCDLVAGRATLVIELKSRFDGDRRVAERAAAVLAGYRGPAALMSFDPLLVETVRAVAPGLTRGIVAERHYDSWEGLTAAQQRQLSWFLHAPRSRPQFIAYAVHDLPAPVPLVSRLAFGIPLLTWTVRTAQDRKTASRWADQMIFEGFRP